MDCKGKNVNEVKSRIRQDISEVISRYGGKLNSDNTVTGDVFAFHNEVAGDFDSGTNIVSEVQTYVGQTLGWDYSYSPWLIHRDGVTRFQIPQDAQQFIQNAVLQQQVQDTHLNEGMATVDTMNDLLAMQKESITDPSFPTLFFSTRQIVSDTMVKFKISDANPTNMHVWIQQKEGLLRRLQESFENYKRYKKGGERYEQTVLRYKREILQLEKSISELKSLPYIYMEDFVADIDTEISYLNSVVENISSNNYDLQTLEDRIEILSQTFLNESLYGGKLDKDTAESNSFTVLNTNQYKDVQALVGKVYTLVDSYKRSKYNLLQSIFLNNAMVRQHLEEGSLEFHDLDGNVFRGEAALEYIFEQIANARGDSGHRRIMATLGAGSGIAGPMGQLMKLTSDVNELTYKGYVTDKLNTIRKNKKAFQDAGFEYYNLEQKDAYGVYSGYLVHKYNDKWWKSLSKSRRFAEAFFKSTDANMREINYQVWMAQKRATEDVFDFRRIRAIKDAMVGNILESHFTYNDEIMSSYESQKRALIGDYMFDTLVKEQIKLLEEYDTFAHVNRNDFKKQIDEQNPFTFMEYFYNQINRGKGQYFYSEYNIFIPKDDSMINADFTSIENNQAAFETWKSIKDLYTDLINPEMKLRGINVSEAGLDVGKIDNVVQSILWENYSGKRKVGTYAKELFDWWRGVMRDSTVLSEDGQPKMQTPGNLRQHGEAIYKRLVEQSFNDVIDKARTTVVNTLRDKTLPKKNRKKQMLLSEEGYQRIQEELSVLRDAVDDSITTDEINIAKARLEGYQNSKKRELARSMANNSAYSSADLDLANVTETLARAAGLAKANRESLVTANFLKSWIADLKNSAEQHGDEVGRLSVLEDFMHVWIRQNLIGEKYFDDHKYMKKGFNSFKKKWKTTKDRRLLKQLKDVVDLTEGEAISFNIKGHMYSQKDGKFTVESPDGITEIDLEQFQDAYNTFVGLLFNGYSAQEVSTGSLTEAFLVRFPVMRSLTLNLATGIANRSIGYMMNDTYAASERFGFGPMELRASRDLLAWGNIDRYARYTWTTFGKDWSIGNSMMSQQRKDNLDTFKLIVGDFELIQNKANAIQGLTKGQRIDKDGFSWFDFAINNPEFHNQGELLLSIMQTTYLDHVQSDGSIVKVPVYDGVKQQWIYEPGTRTLRPEYRTPENIRIWETFEVSEEGNNPQLKMLIRGRAAVARSHGNYSDRDKIMLQASRTGAAFLSLKRYLPEQVYTQLANEQSNLMLGKAGQIGRARIMSKYNLAGGVMMGSMGFTDSPMWGVVAAGVLGTLGVAVSPLAAFGVAGAAGATGIYILRRGLKRRMGELESQKVSATDQLKVAGLVLTESLVRFGDRFLGAVTQKVLRGKDISTKRYEIIEGILEKTREVAGNPVENPNEVKALTELAQDFNNKYSIVLGIATMQYVLRLVSQMLRGTDYDEEDDPFGHTRINMLQGYANIIINRYGGMVLGDQVRLYDPFIIGRELTPAALNTVRVAARLVTRQIPDYIRGTRSIDPILSSLQRLAPLPIPNNLADLWLRPQSSLLGHDRVVNPRWWGEHPDEFLNRQERSATPNFNNQVRSLAERQITFQRGQLRDEVQASYLRAFQREVESWTPEQQRALARTSMARRNVISEYATIAARQTMRAYNRPRGMTPEDFLNQMDFRAWQDHWRNDNVQHSTSLERLRMQERARRAMR